MRAPVSRAIVFGVLILAACAAAHSVSATRAPSSPTATTPTTAAPSSNCGGGRRMTVHFYDVGQALAALVDLPDGRHLLIDAGDSPRRAECDDCREKHHHLMTGLAHDLGQSPIDLLWITHQHSDHLGGAADVIDAFQVGAYVDNGRDATKAEVRRVHEAADRRGARRFTVDPSQSALPVANPSDVTLTPIVPTAWPRSCAHDENECSIGLRVDFCASSVLFTGDSEHEEETRLDLHGPLTLLQVGHHGSETSSSPAFLARARPRYAVVSAGKPDEGLNHDYCHPRAGIVRRLTAVLGGTSGEPLRAFDGERCDRAQPADWVDVPASDRLWATERDGDVVLTTTGDGTFVRE